MNVLNISSQQKMYFSQPNLYKLNRRYMPLKHMKVPIQIFHLEKPFLVGNEITAKFGGDFEKFLTKSKLAVTKVSGDKISLCYLENKQWQRL